MNQNGNHRRFRLEKSSKILESNHQPSAAKATTKPFESVKEYFQADTKAAHLDEIWWATIVTAILELKKKNLLKDDVDFQEHNKNAHQEIHTIIKNSLTQA